MYKKAVGLSCLLFTNILMASSLYIPQLVFSNKTSNLTIRYPIPGPESGYPIGPTDATVIDNTFVVLDTYGSSVAYFDFNGALLKRISLPRDIQFQNIVRDRDNSLFVFGTDKDRTKIIHIQNEVITEQAVYQLTDKKISRYISYILPDDYGLIMVGSEVPARPKVDEVAVEFQNRIDRTCITCLYKPVKGPQVGGLLYHTTSAKDSLFFIGKKEIPLKLYPKVSMNSYEIIQVDQDGTAWVDNLITVNGSTLTYVWKVNKQGEILGVYRFASETESRGTPWPMQRELIVSNDGKVYGLISNKNQFKLALLTPLSLDEMKIRAKELDALLFKKKDLKSKKRREGSSLEYSTALCKARNKVIDDAYDFIMNKIYLSVSSIKNDATCPNRTIPPYILEVGGKAQTYDSVSYNWGGFDTIAEFNKKILTNKMKAGNVNDRINPLLSCAAGIDCSGYVSRVLGLTTKLGTRDLASVKFSEEIDWFEMKPGDIYINPGVHVVLFRMKSDMFWRKIYILESRVDCS
ncbi:hypothetical protein [Legionella sp. km772]|uniref:hypothetical protein n=1 Tax=Legionella sp. km772 TaxID=2498111 RepID=UPI000F8F5F84|nr:hypothetical protein [Legionella sp. km772]RUR06573.1 hypothetical protein ELY15_13075 [Legionella sp. km772]